MPQINAISFDGDGTLIGSFTSSPRGFETFFIEAARSRGKTVTFDTLKPILAKIKAELILRKKEGYKPHTSSDKIRQHWLWIYEKIFHDLELPKPKGMALEYIERFETGEFASIYPDVIPTLEALRSHKIPMILVSNYGSLLNEFLEKFKIADYFHSVFISGIIGIEKPDKEIYLMGAEKLGLPPSEILHVGNDLEEDYHASKSAGYQAILLDRDNLHPNNNVEKINTLAELLKLNRDTSQFLIKP